MEVGCYDLLLYCDNCWGTQWARGDFPHEFTGKNITDCRRQARTKGWKLGKRLLCPTCYAKKREQVSRIN